MSGTINLACTLNDSYALPFTVMIASVLGTRRDSTPLTFHVLDSGLSPATRTAIEAAFASDRVTFQWHRVPSSVVVDVVAGIDGGRGPVFYQTLLLPQALPTHMQRVLYLDVDLIALQPIEPLWEIDLGECDIGAVQDMAIPTVASPQGVRDWRALGLAANRPYFNAGVMLIDLARWRSRRVTERAVEYLRAYRGRAAMCAQDAYNATLDRWKPLALRWNVIASLGGRTFFDAEALNAREYREAIARPAIMHFAGRLKPWLTRTGSRFDALFHDWRARAPRLSSRDRPSLADAAAGYYDRMFRSMLYPVERFFWERRP